MLDWLTLDGDRGEKLDCTMVGERGEMLDWLTAGGDRGERLCCLTTAGELAHPSKSSSDSVSVTAWKELARFVRDHSDIEELSTVLNVLVFSIKLLSGETNILLSSVQSTSGSLGLLVRDDKLDRRVSLSTIFIELRLLAVIMVLTCPEQLLWDWDWDWDWDGDCSSFWSEEQKDIQWNDFLPNETRTKSFKLTGVWAITALLGLVSADASLVAVIVSIPVLSSAHFSFEAITQLSFD